ncbi:hypothetical protein MBRA_50020 (plasmid) [Mycobacterium branderi]|uniref:Putative succinate-semialdehyde dehydrogenase [NADP(+)] 2 n=1 Tax=Mycobacterium branderi TaxID=43348 RepID=A0ABN6BAP0_9MYCO|nr:hypothetical protein MBRA_50020 [Mycobacterium branderi]
MIRTNADELTTTTVIENATPVSLAAHSPHLTADLFEYNAGWADKIGGTVEATWPVPAFDYTVEEPYGVIGVIIPWNGPCLHRHGCRAGSCRRKLCRVKASRTRTMDQLAFRRIVVRGRYSTGSRQRGAGRAQRR